MLVSYSIDVFQLSFNFLCLLLLYIIYLNGQNACHLAREKPGITGPALIGLAQLS